MSTSQQSWPPLPLEAWADTQATLHMWSQIVGKTRLALSPAENHWWHIALYATTRGLTTSPMPYRERTLEVELDFLEHVLVARTSDGASRSIPLAPRSVADFYEEYRGLLRSLGVECSIVPRPVEVDPAVPFLQDTGHAAYDAEAVSRWWRATALADRAFKRFRGRFQGKASPSHFFWGSFDLATTRFSGRPAPRHPGGAPNTPNEVMVEAYCCECASAGFWPGAGLGEAAFYAYSYPEPAGYAAAAVRPEGAYYHPDLHEFILPYEAVRAAAAPEQTLLEFLQSTYEIAADLAKWDRAQLDRPREVWP